MNVKSFMQLPITKDFSIVAGIHGLSNPVNSVEILDFEFSPDIQTVRETIFNRHSVVLSSLLFARQKPEYLIDTIKNLIELGVSALAYKPVIFQNLPDEVVAFANNQNFPILQFGGDEFFEDIILEVVAYTKQQDKAHKLETIIKKLIEKKVNEEQIHSFLQQLNKPFEKYVFAANLQIDTTENTEWIDSLFQLEPLLKSGIICTYKKSIFILMTNTSKYFQFENILNEWMTMYAIPKESFIIGYSQVQCTQKTLHLAVREAFFARIMAEINVQPTCHYEKLATDTLLIELYRENTPFAMKFVHKYLDPLLDEKVDPDLIQTAISYILKKGNIKEVANSHFCHPNTIRYRMTKIRQLIAPADNDFVFYEQLSAAIKLHLLHNRIEKSAIVFE
ncbi:PucR family transcriptional regulator [Rummeliibacillus pycnus]|uniref:PucR family transcriptional regulator n=1 Tax=Rummeliibacillus pycnus TaxID=101070 RepID=UPI003D2B65E1